jgi:hypothetical protein
MWAWNTAGKMMLSKLHGNLIVLFYDYITEKPFLSFIGSNKLSESTAELLQYSEQKFQINYLKLIPEIVVSELSDSEFLIAPDEDSHDYISSVSFLKNLGHQTASKRTHAGKGCKRFLRLYPHYSVKVIDCKDNFSNEHVELFARWANNNHKNHCTLNEFKAFERLLQEKENENSILSIYDGATLIGFITLEILSGDYSIVHFSKADVKYIGIYDALFYEAGKLLEVKGVKYLNLEQDLGIPTLRESKRKYKPVLFLKKFTITQRP